MDADILEWLNITARWIHVFAGIMWIGQTYFFTWLDGRFTELESQAKSAATVWMVHSGGFYLVEKQKHPALIPTKLHWFKWEATITWLSGIALLVIVYYFGGVMVDTSIADVEGRWLILLSVCLLLAAWPFYALVWHSPIGRNEMLGASVSFVAVAAIVYLVSQYMSGRAAYMQIGAMFGTIMAVNVWHTIIPAQKKMVSALEQGKEPDLLLAGRAKSCSRHNTFMAVPVVFIMISNHFPTATYGMESGWLVLMAMILMGWLVAKVVRRAP
jgi:uncharacterized membrane protein